MDFKSFGSVMLSAMTHTKRVAKANNAIYKKKHNIKGSNRFDK
tara:strand:+ start:1348 stop:1476 length:129 start_codon:yes stop_codon:yes gene_type:complete